MQFFRQAPHPQDTFEIERQYGQSGPTGRAPGTGVKYVFGNAYPLGGLRHGHGRVAKIEID